MRECFKPLFGFSAMDGLSLHYYTIPGGWSDQRPASPVSPDDWADVMALGWRMDEIIRGHSEIMDRHDPEKKTAIVIDEWGAWYKADEGTNPRFLYQQQTMRDGVLAALNLNIFINHCDRVRFANLAQVVNVLQAVALTEPEGGRLVLTPTWDVFSLYAVHQEAKSLPVSVECTELTDGKRQFPQISATASLSESGEINVTLTNTDSANEVELSFMLVGASTKQLQARVISSPGLSVCNTFDEPRAISTRDWAGVQVAGDKVLATIPAGSVAALKFS